MRIGTSVLRRLHLWTERSWAVRSSRDVSPLPEHLDIWGTAACSSKQSLMLGAHALAALPVEQQVQLKSPVYEGSAITAALFDHRNTPFPAIPMGYLKAPVSITLFSESLQRPDRRLVRYPSRAQGLMLVMSGIGVSSRSK